MYIPKKLKLNQYRVCQIPSAREIVQRFGQASGQFYSGDELASRPMTKLDAAAALEYMNSRQLREEQNNSDYEQNKDQL